MSIVRLAQSFGRVNTSACDIWYGTDLLFCSMSINQLVNRSQGKQRPGAQCDSQFGPGIPRPAHHHKLEAFGNIFAQPRGTTATAKHAERTISQHFMRVRMLDLHKESQNATTGV